MIIETKEVISLMETITISKRDNNYEITIHKGFTNITITKDREYL